MAELELFSQERLHDSNETHMWQKEILLCSFVQKRSIISQEITDLELFSPERFGVIHLVRTHQGGEGGLSNEYIVKAYL